MKSFNCDYLKLLNNHKEKFSEKCVLEKDVIKYKKQIFKDSN
jgi:hypothetical protein